MDLLRRGLPQPTTPRLEQTPEAFQDDQSCAPFARSTKPVQTTSLRAPAHSRKRSHWTARPNCTHIHMVKLYGAWHVCDLCGRQPRIGFIYACEQDHTRSPVVVSPSLSRHASRKREALSKDSAGPLRRLLGSSAFPSAKEIESGVLSHWIVSATTRGEYTNEQISIMKAQKRNVQRTIMDNQAQLGHSSPRAIAEKLSSLGLQHLASPSVLDATLVAHSASASPSENKANPSNNRFAQSSGGICDFKVCHACRPVSRDRVWISIEAALDGEVEMPIYWHPFTMPVADVEIMRNIGTKGSQGLYPQFEPLLSPGSISPIRTAHNLSSMTFGATADDLTDKFRPSSADFRSSLRKNLIELLNTREGLPLPDTNLARRSINEATSVLPDAAGEKSSASDLALAHFSLNESLSSIEGDGLDIELWRALAEEEQRRAASTHLPGEDDSRERLDLDEGLVDSGNFADAGIQITEIADGERLIRNEEHGAVELGVTLTEEAIDNRVPDFIIAPV